MTEMHTAAPPDSPVVRDRRGFRIALLSVATAILLIGAAAAGVYGYAAIAHLR
jgi:hypothetical protein